MSPRRSAHRPRPSAWSVLVAVLLVLTVGCSSTDSPAAGGRSPAPATVSSAPPPPAPPVVGSCHALAFAAASAPVDPTDAVPCTSLHTSVTVQVGRLDDLTDGHLLAVDSTTVRDKLASTCPPAAPAYVGGSPTQRRLSRFQQVWFTPAVSQARGGADWYRCDVLVPDSASSLASLPPTVQGVLSRPGAMTRFGTCGSAAPGTAGFTRLACAQPHRWQAIDVIALAPGAGYLQPSEGARADAACKDRAAARANGATSYTWSFEWPTRQEFDAGRRYGLCWVPAT